MSRTHVIRIESVEELRRAAAAWDDLWWRSASDSPLYRAETLALWLEQFATDRRFCALITVEDDHWIAAAPLVSQRLGRVVSLAALPNNPWASCGDLLLDINSDGAAAMDALLGAAKQSGFPLCWFDEALPETPQWQALLASGNRRDAPMVYHQRFRVGRLRIAGNWNAYQKRLPKNHRQAMTRSAKRLNEQGRVEFKLSEKIEPAAVEPMLREAFELEDLGWKGRQGSSVLGAPGMFEFYLRLARQLARWGQLAHAELRLDGRLLAFVHGFQAKGVFFANKISYHPDFAALSPGQLLFWFLIERLHDRRQISALDFMGPMNQSLGRWRPETYGVGRLVAATGGFWSRRLLGGYKLWRRLRDRRGNEASGAALPAIPSGVEKAAEKTPAMPAEKIPADDECAWSVP